MNYILPLILLIFFTACSTKEQKVQKLIKIEKALTNIEKIQNDCSLPSNTNLFKCYYKKALEGDLESQRKVVSYYIKRKEFKKAESWLIRLSKEGDLPSMKELAHFYDIGIGNIKEDKKKALLYYTTGTKYNDAYSQYYVGYYYKRGWGVKKDYQKAMMWFKKAATQDYSPAMSEIGYLYVKGLGYDKDDFNAFKWFMRAANKDDNYAMSWVGYFYEKGRVAKQSNEKAIYWYKKSGNTYSKKRLEILKSKGIE